jgi:hypothetical protein
MSESSKSGVNAIGELSVALSEKVAGLSDRPNQTGVYGASGLTAQGLKNHFDLYSDKIAEKVNEIIDKLSNGNGDYLSISTEKELSLYDLVASFEDGSWAGKFQIKPPASEKTNLLAFLNGLNASISALQKDGSVSTEKIANQAVTSEKIDENLLNDLRQSFSNVTFTKGDRTFKFYRNDGKTDTWIALNLQGMVFEDELKGFINDIVYDTGEYKLTFKRKEGEDIEIDLPIETLVLSVEYVSASKSLRITLKNENVIEVSLGDIISGLVNYSDILHTTGTSDNKVMSQKAVTDALKNVDGKHINLVRVDKVIDYNTGTIIPTLKIERENGDFVGIALDDLIPSKIKESFSDVSYEESTGKLKFTGNDGKTSKTVDLPLELLVSSGEYNSDTKQIELTLANKTDVIRIDLKDLADKIDVQIKDGSITTSKIADEAVTEDKIADDAVATNYDADGNVANSKIKKDAVYTEAIRDKTVTSEKIADQAVTGEKIANYTVSAMNLNDNVIGYSKLQSGTTRADLQNSYSNASHDGHELKLTPNEGKITTIVLPLDELEKRVETLEGLTLAKITDNTVAYEKVVPANVGSRAAINKVGGMSYKSRNICVADGPATLENETSYYRNLGTYGPGRYYIEVIGNLINVGTYLFFPSGMEFPNGYGYIELDAESEIDLQIDANSLMGGEEDELISGTITGIMLCPEDEEDKSYEPYFEGVKYVKPTSIESCGKNLAYKQYGITSSGAGVSSTMLIGDGTRKVCGSLIPVKAGEKYALSKTYADPNSEFRWFFFDREPILNETKSIGGNYQQSLSKYVITIPDNATYLYVRWTSNEEEFPCGDVQIEFGDKVTEYKPYSAEPIDTFEIPEAIRNLPGYGIGKSATECNYIDFDDKTFVYEYDIVDGEIKPIESTKTDISSYLPNYLKYFYMDVEPGGTLKFINDGSNDVPSTVTYVKKL